MTKRLWNLFLGLASIGLTICFYSMGLVDPGDKEFVIAVFWTIMAMECLYIGICMPDEHEEADLRYGLNFIYVPLMFVMGVMAFSDGSYVCGTLIMMIWIAVILSMFDTRQ